MLKKKFLVQVRDPRTLIIEMMFPIIFIFAGLALATVKPIKPGVPRPLSPSIFPEPSHLYFNDKIPFGSLKDNDTKSTIIDGSFTEKFWDINQAVSINYTGNYTDIVSQYDDFLYNNSENVGNGFFGNYFFYNLDEADPK